tara:strand:- start:6056 stop:8113 length:2058 start_codon:yes stop_codon:yes gene_type:complete
MADKKTPDNLFQRLTKLFRSGPSIKRKVKDYSKADKNASSAVELFKKSHSDVYNSTLSAYGTFDRMARYSDFSEMESTPEIASALDIYAEESCSQDAEGRVLHIYSNNRKAKELLETLFYDTLNINFNLVMWTRNLCKYGDFFLFNDVSPEYGVINAYPVPITEMEREEGYDKDDPSAVRFRWITQGNTILENWQVSHFRLLGNDAFLPYGSSVLEAARRIWRQLILIEDAMMVYRVIRSPERRVFYIDVGNVPPEDVANYVEQAKNSLKVNKVTGQANGNVDLRYNPMAVDEDYFIPVRGGDSGTRIESLAGGQNTSAIEDVEYVQKKLFAALKIPKAYLGYDEEVGSKATLAQEDIRFSRSIARIQKTLIAELNKMAMIHLYAHGFDGEDLLDFSLALSNPSSLAQQQKLSLIEQKFTIAGSAPEGMVSKTWIYQNIFGFNRDTIEAIHSDLIREKLEAAEIESAGAEGDDEGGGDDAGGGGDLFAADTPTGQILDAGDDIKIVPQLGETDELDEDLLDDEEDEDYIDLEKISSEAGEIKPSETAKGVFGQNIKSKRDRSVKFGAQDLNMPSFKNMLGGSRPQDTMNDPYDSSWVRNWGKRNQFESNEQRLADLIAGMDSGIKDIIPPTIKPNLSYDTQRMLEKMNSKLGIRRLMTESNNYEQLIEESFDLDFEIEDDGDNDE